MYMSKTLALHVFRYTHFVCEIYAFDDNNFANESLMLAGLGIALKRIRSNENGIRVNTEQTSASYFCIFSCLVGAAAAEQREAIYD